MVKTYLSTLETLTKTTDVYDYLGRVLAGRIPKSVIVVVQLDVNSNDAFVYGFYGLGMPWFNKLISVLGINPVGKHFDLTSEGRSFYYTDTCFRKFNGSIYQFAGGQITEWIAKSIEKLFNIRDIYTVALNYAQTPIGTVLIFNRQRHQPHFDGLELFVHEGSRRLFQIINKNKRELRIPTLKDEFTQNLLGNLSHEIRTPLNGILGMLEVVQLNKTLSSDAVNVPLFEEVWTNAQVLTRNIESLVLASELATHSVTLNMASLPASTICQLVNRVTERLKLLYKTREIRLVVPEPSEHSVSYDTEKLAYLIDELVTNALKFSEKHVEVTLSFTDCVDIEVKDFGIGLTEEEQAVIFEHFARVTYSNRIYRGMGLGLFNCYQIAVLHNGTLQLISMHMAGTLVKLRLPFVGGTSV